MKTIKLSVGVNDQEFLNLVSILAKKVRSGKWQNVRLVVNGKLWVSTESKTQSDCMVAGKMVDVVTGHDRSEFFPD